MLVVSWLLQEMTKNGEFIVGVLATLHLCEDISSASAALRDCYV